MRLMPFPIGNCPVFAPNSRQNLSFAQHRFIPQTNARTVTVPLLSNSRLQSQKLILLNSSFHEGDALATVLMTWELGGGLGHLMRLQPLAHGLAQRGHRVVLALRDLSKAAMVFGDRCSFLQAPCKIAGPDQPIHPTLTFAHILHNVGFADAQELGTLAGAWRQLYDLARPDLIIFDHSPTALLAARGLPAKKCIVGSGFFIPPDQSPLPNLSPWHKADIQQLEQDETRILQNINRVARACSQTPLERITQLFSHVDESFLLTFRELDHYPLRSGASYWGSWNNTSGAAPQWPTAPGPRIFAYLKATPSAPQILRFLNDVQKPTIAVVPQIDEALRQQLNAPTLRIEQRPLDLCAIARECDLAILNGNHASTLAILLGGKPTLQIPVYLEQILFAKRVASIGAALEVDANKLHEFAGALQQLLAQERFAAAAREFAQRYADFDPQAQAQRIVQRMEDLMRDGKSDTSAAASI